MCAVKTITTPTQFKWEQFKFFGFSFSGMVALIVFVVAGLHMFETYPMYLSKNTTIQTSSLNTFNLMCLNSTNRDPDNISCDDVLKKAHMPVRLVAFRQSFEELFAHFSVPFGCTSNSYCSYVITKAVDILISNSVSLFFFGGSCALAVFYMMYKMRMQWVRIQKWKMTRMAKKEDRQEGEAAAASYVDALLGTASYSSTMPYRRPLQQQHNFLLEQPIAVPFKTYNTDQFHELPIDYRGGRGGARNAAEDNA